MAWFHYVGQAAMVAIIATQGVGCADRIDMPPDSSALMQEKLRGMSKQELIGCAGSPLNEATQDEVSVLSYYKECSMFDRSCVGSKGNIPAAR